MENSEDEVITLYLGLKKQSWQKLISSWVSKGYLFTIVNRRFRRLNRYETAVFFFNFKTRERERERERIQWTFVSK